jgi:hypothetical protein
MGTPSPPWSVRRYRLLAQFRAFLGVGPGGRSVGRFSLRVFLDAQQVACPQLFEAPHPAFINLPDRHDVQRVDPLPALFPCLNQPGLAKHVNVLHHPEASQVRKSLDDLCGRAGALPQEVRSVADAWRERIASLLEKVVVGRADDPNSQMGPLIDRANVERVDRLVEDAKRYARIIVRGGPIVDGPLAAGAFYRPAMLETEALDVPLVQEEIFGPVLSFETFATEDEAITRANATVFGLASALFTKDLDRAYRVARAVFAPWKNFRK